MDEYKDLVLTIKGQTDRLTRLSEDLLLLTREDHDRLDRDLVDVSALAAEVVNELQAVATAKSVHLVTSLAPELEVETNPDLLYRCVLNLVDNGIKYSGTGSTVSMRALASERTATIEVADNGAGIPAEDVDRVFDRFYRVDRGRSRREGGTGLGLAIVKELVESLGGTVRAASEVGKGSTFSIALPLAPAGQSSAAGEASA
jgi:two-component system phosphate regulon sensor histidine kinase PhoR